MHRITEIGWQGLAGRLSEAARAHKIAVKKTQCARVGGVAVWVPVAPTEQTVEEQELSLQAVMMWAT